MPRVSNDKRFNKIRNKLLASAVGDLAVGDLDDVP